MTRRSACSPPFSNAQTGWNAAQTWHRSWMGYLGFKQAGMLSNATSTSRGRVTQSVNTVLAGGGEMGALMRALDWSTTPLGPVENWPQSLRSVVSMLLPSKAQIILFWGPEF